MKDRRRAEQFRSTPTISWSNILPSLLPRDADSGQRMFGPRDFTTFMILIFPLFGAFYPLETYLNAGGVSVDYPITTITLSVSLVLLFYEGAQQRVHQLYFRYETLVLVFYALLALATVAWSPDTQYTLFRSARLLPSIGFGLILADAYSLRRLCAMLTLVFFLVAAGSVFLVLFFPSIGLSHLDNGYEDAWRGVLVHKNAAGFLFSIGVLVVGYSYFARILPRSFTAITWLLCTVMLVKSNSATALVSAIVAIAAAAGLNIMSRADRNVRLLLICGFGILCIPVTYLITDPSLIVALTGRDMTFTGRTAIWEAVFRLIKDSPLRGYGYGFWGMDTPMREFVWSWVGDKAAHSHNSWLDIWLQCGIFGLIALVVIALGSVLRGFRLFVGANQPGVILFLAILISVLIRSFTEVEFTDPGISGVFWLALATGFFGKLTHQMVSKGPIPNRVKRRA